MNPLIIAGTLAVAISSSAMMVSFSSDQAEYSRSVEEASRLQAERMQEELAVSLDGENQLLLENTGPIPVVIKEVRLLDDGGNVVSKQKLSTRLHAAQLYRLDTNTDIKDAIGRIVARHMGSN